VPPTDPIADTGSAATATTDVDHADAEVDTDFCTEADSGTDECAAAPGSGTGLCGTETEPGAPTDGEDTLDLHLPDELGALIAVAESADEGRAPSGGAVRPAFGTPTGDDLLDRVADWGPTATPAGVFHLVPVRLERDLSLISRWMNSPAVARFWGLSGPPSVTEEHVWAQLAGDGRSVPCIGVLEGTPMSYWELYRADLDPLARHYPARPHDTGIHLLIGTVSDRGRGLGSTLLRAVADLALDRRPACARIVAEPHLCNTPSVVAFMHAGFRFSAEVELPAKRAALMVRDRSLRDLL
jgi:RimJ/RimL family protein N-acetyltransferase